MLLYHYEDMNLGFSEMLFIFLLALIIFGPKKMPEIGRQIGKALAEFKRASNEFKAQLETEMRQMEIEEVLRKEKENIAQALQPPDGTVVSGSLADSDNNILPPPPAPAAPMPEATPQTAMMEALLNKPADEPANSDAAKGTDA